MSCFILDIDRIKTLCVTYQSLDENENNRYNREEIEENIDILHRENVNAYNYRYEQSDHINKAPYQIYSTRHIEVEKTFDMVQALKTLLCLDYNSDEKPDYKDSVAKSLIEDMKIKFIMNLPSFEEKVWG